MNVLEIQTALAARGLDPGPLDGIWGRRTIKAVMAFQAGNGLPVTGVVDPQTERQIFAGSPGAVDTSAFVWMREARRLRGLKEVQGPGSNPIILDWAKDLDIAYGDDDIPWCGLFVAHCIGSTLPTEPLPTNPLGARNWANFGNPTTPVAGAVLVFWRKSKASGLGHVGFYMTEDAISYTVLGGNQSDQVGLARMPKDRFLEARWPASAAGLHSGVVIAGGGEFSTKES